METRFQTSFIPKKPMVSVGGASAPVHHKSTSLYMGLSTIVFILSLAAVGGAYAWKSYLASAQESYKSQLAAREQQFNTDLIEQLKLENVKIDTAKQLLRNHLAYSGIFDIISRLTIQNVRFMNMDIAAPSTPSSDLKVSLQGYGTSFSAVAFQSDVLGQLEQYGLRKIVKNPILSNPALGGNGTVSFGFSASIDPGSLSYEKAVLQSVAPATTTDSIQDQGASQVPASSQSSPFTQ